MATGSTDARLAAYEADVGPWSANDDPAEILGRIRLLNPYEGQAMTLADVAAYLGRLTR